MLKIEDDKYTRLLEDYTVLKEINKDCEIEYRRLATNYNLLQEKLQEIKETINKKNMSIKKLRNKYKL